MCGIIIQVKVECHESSHVSADLPESLHVSADLPESLHISAHPPESLHVSAHPPESLHITVDHPESCHVLSITPRYSGSVLRFPSLVSSVRDAPLVSAHAAGIPRATHFNPSVLELFPLSEALPMTRIALCCVWAAYTTSELPQAMAPAAASPELAAHAAEPSEASVLASAPCMVVAPRNSCLARHITVEGIVDEHSTCPANELYLFPDITTVEPPEVVASAAEPSEVSVVTIYESSSCPLTAMEAVCESSSCPVTAMEAVCESSSCPVTALEAICESSSCPVTAMEAVYELPGCSVPATEAALEPLPCSEPAEEAISELALYVCPVSTKEPDFELSASPGSATEMSASPVSLNEFVFELSVLPVSVNELSASVTVYVPDFELSVSPVPAKAFDYELSVGPVPVTEMSVSPVSLNVSVFKLSILPVTAMETLNELSVCLVNSVIAKDTPSEQSVYAVPVPEFNIDLSVCPTTFQEANTESVALSVITPKPAFEPLDPPVMSPETVNAIETT